ncbi:unnamed protein product [Discosporangium mesarthrocarpum]
MAGKEAVIFAVDCGGSMVPHMDVARSVIKTIMTQKMLQSKQNEMGIIMFGLPEDQTSNVLHDQDQEGYKGIKEVSGLERGSVDLLRSLSVIQAVEEEGGASDLLDAMIVGVHMIHQRTQKL